MVQIDKKELVSPSKRQKVAHARAVVSHIATEGLLISGSNVARRLNVDRSAVSRAVRRVGDDPDLIETAGSILEKLGLTDPATSQHRNYVPFGPSPSAHDELLV